MAENANQDSWQQKELGVLWKRKKKGTNESFLTGRINLKNLGFDKDVEVIIFTNKKKTEEKHPDLRIYVSEPRPNGGAQATAPTPAAKKPAAPAAKPAPAAPPAQDEELI